MATQYTEKYPTDWEVYNSRDANTITVAIMQQCLFLNLSAGATSKILFAAGYPKKAENITKFFEGLQNWLDTNNLKNGRPLHPDGEQYRAKAPPAQDPHWWQQQVVPGWPSDEDIPV